MNLAYHIFKCILCDKEQSFKDSKVWVKPTENIIPATTLQLEIHEIFCPLCKEKLNTLINPITE